MAMLLLSRSLKCNNVGKGAERLFSEARGYTNCNCGQDGGNVDAWSSPIQLRVFFLCHGSLQSKFLKIDFFLDSISTIPAV